MDRFRYTDSREREREIAWKDGQPHLRTANGWHPCVPTPIDLRKNEALLGWLLERARCLHCGEPIDFITIFTGCTRATWPRYCSTRCRETAQKRRYRKRLQENT